MSEDGPDDRPDDGPDLEMRLERLISAPHDARCAVRRLLGDAATDEFWQNALLTTSEIVTHSLTDSSGDCRLAAWLAPSPGWLRVEITDRGEMPSIDRAGDARAAHEELGGMRLAVLAEIPSAWGIEHTAFGRVLWFEVQQACTSPSR